MVVVVVVGRGWKVCNSVLLPTGSRCAMNFSKACKLKKKSGAYQLNEPLR